jgi:hypothetical protein
MASGLWRAQQVVGKPGDVKAIVWTSPAFRTEEAAVAAIQMLVVRVALKSLGIAPSTFCRLYMKDLYYEKVKRGYPMGVKVPMFGEDDGWGKDLNVDMKRMMAIANG